MKKIDLMSRYFILFLLGILIVSCKNDTSAKSTVIAEEAAGVKDDTKTIVDSRKADRTKSRVEEVKPAPIKLAEASNDSNGKMDTVTVSTVEEIVENAKSNTVMYINKGTYELEAEIVYFMTKDERKIIDKRVVETRSIGGQLFFSGLSNFQIIGKKGVQIVSKNPGAVAFFMIQGTNIKISNISIKKEINGTADLSYFSRCKNVELENCNLIGGGQYAFYINGTENMKVKSSKITKCTSGAVKIHQSKGINFINSTITNNTFKLPIINFYADGSEVAFNNVTISNNKKNPKSTFENSDRIFAVGNNTVKIDNCVIQNNVGYKNLGLDMGSVNRSQIDGVLIP